MNAYTRERAAYALTAAVLAAAVCLSLGTGVLLVLAVSFGPLLALFTLAGTVGQWVEDRRHG